MKAMVKALPKFKKHLAVGSFLTLRRQDDLKALFASLCLLMFLTGAVFAPFLGLDPIKQDLSARLRPPVWCKGGNWENILGVDYLGRDTLSRLVYGARVSLLVGFLSVVIGSTIGTTLGLLAGLYKGRIDTIIMRMVDTQLSFPVVLLVMLIVAVVGPSLMNIIVALGLVGWAEYARLVRAEVLKIREESYIEATRAIGASNLRIIIQHILPNIIAPVVVLATFAVPSMILTESALSWLGLSVPPPTPTWGGMIADSRDYLLISWWTATLPGLAIMLVVLSLNLLGDWVRDRLDPRLRRIEYKVGFR